MRSVAILLVFLCCGAAAQAAEPYKVGMARRDFVPAGDYDWRQDPKHVLATVIWYPAAPDAQEEAQPFGPPGRPYFDLGPAALDAPLAAVPKKFPLVVLSHGFGATAANMAWLGRALAAHGYVAAAVNHPGNNAIDGVTVPGATLWWLRARDLSAVIDGLLADQTFGPRIDDKRIGAAGDSAGGFTVIEIAGGIMSRANFRTACKLPKPDKQCGPPPDFPGFAARFEALAKSDPDYRTASEEVRSYRDPRVRAVFAMAPGLAGAFQASSLTHIDIPVMIVAGAADERVPVERNAAFFASIIPHARLTVFPPPVGHMVFAGMCLEAARTTLTGVCNDPPGVDRAAVEAKTARLAKAFFDQVLH
jgi:predicted dienelactone hydrolase